MRDYNLEAKNTEDHQYAYDFDYIMHEFMLRTLLKFKYDGRKVLELGCYHGNFTSLLANQYDEVTVIDASDECIDIAKKKVGGHVKFVHSTFEEAELNETYDVIFFVHTLEHIDDHLNVLSKIKKWLSPNGVLFVATPNANAPSRQIAVKMGLITHNSAITKAEKEHGHTITYSLDRLERDVRNADYGIVQRGGVFFKGLANFQLDRALKEGIIDRKYLEGCYDLGMIYPDLCSSIFVIGKL